MAAYAIHYLYNEISSFVKKMLLRFMTPSDVLSAINLTALVHLPLSEIFIGEKAKQYILCDDMSTANVYS